MGTFILDLIPWMGISLTVITWWNGGDFYASSADSRQLLVELYAFNKSKAYEEMIYPDNGDQQTQ